MNILKSTCFVLILTLVCETDAYKFLVVFPIPVRSHSILGSSVVEHLAKAGHEVTFITPFAPDDFVPNVTVIDVGDKLKHSYSGGTMNLKALMDNTGDSNSIFTYVPMMFNMYKLALEHPYVQKLMTDNNQQFDAVIGVWMYAEIVAGLAGVFNCPFIWYSTLEPHWMIMQLVDEIPNPAYSVDFLSFSKPPLTFIQRVLELVYQTIGKLVQVFWISSLDNDLYEKMFVPIIRNRRPSVPSLDTLKNNVSLVLSNSHVSIGGSVRLPPNFICIGGHHIKSNITLPKELKELMDNSTHGVIYFSMGSNLRSKYFPDIVKRKLLEVFGKLKQTVIWKFEENLPNRPSNVHILPWTPQQSILGFKKKLSDFQRLLALMPKFRLQKVRKSFVGYGISFYNKIPEVYLDLPLHKFGKYLKTMLIHKAHNNCILFITHGGQLSTTEIIHFGVPSIGIPGYADQFINIKRAVDVGITIKVELSYNMAADLELAIKEILNNTKYTAKVQELSRIYHDRPIPPSKELVHWVEHVVKTQGALHLRSPAFTTPCYQKLYLDLIISLLIVFSVLMFAIIYIKREVLRQIKYKTN